jgi:hypothetical protein
MGIVFWIGIIAGFLVMRHFAGPLFAKSITGDFNRIIGSDPQLKQKVTTQLTPTQLQQARTQGLNI